MLPDFPKIKNKLIKQFLEEEMKKSYMGSVILSSSHLVLHEGYDSYTIRENGKEEKQVYHKTKTEITVDLADLKKSTPDELLQQFVSAGKDIAKQQNIQFVEDLKNVAENMGQVFDAKGSPVTPEMLLTQFEGYPMDFDRTGKPVGLDILAGEVLFKRLVECFKEIEANPKYAERFKEIVEKKRSEWRDRENNRELVG